MNNKRKIINIGVIILIVLVLVVGGVYLVQHKKNVAKQNQEIEISDIDSNDQSGESDINEELEQEGKPLEQEQAQEQEEKLLKNQQATEDKPIENLLEKDFSMMDLQGNMVELSTFLGKPTVLNFWASWCGPCKIEMPDFDIAYKEHKDEVNFVLVNLTDSLKGSGETPDKAKKFIEDNKYSFPIYFDILKEGASGYAVMSIPSTFILNSQGEIVFRKMGVMTYQELIEAINKAYDDDFGVG